MSNIVIHLVILRPKNRGYSHDVARFSRTFYDVCPPVTPTKMEIKERTFRVTDVDWSPEIPNIIDIYVEGAIGDGGEFSDFIDRLSNDKKWVRDFPKD